MSDKGPDTSRSRYMRGLGMSARNNHLACGYSVAITALFAILDHTAGG